MTKHGAIVGWTCLLLAFASCSKKSGQEQVDAGEPDAASPPTTLRSAAATRGLLYGCAVTTSELTDSAFSAAYARECGLLVPDNELKWDAIRPTSTTFDFTAGDALLAYADGHGMKMRGHTLVWHSALPSWFASMVNAQNAQQILTDHITAVATHYAGKLHSWDVVNEAVNIPDGNANGLRSSPWLTLIGPSYIPLAFQTAHTADPNALLCYNDFGLEGEAEDAKRAAVLQLLTSLKSQGVPIDCLGIQSHLPGGTGFTFNAQKYAAFLQSVEALGIKILITELDVLDNAFPGDIATRDGDVASLYTTYLTGALADRNVIAVLTWGLSDHYTWLSFFAPRSDGLPVRPLPLDANLQKKPAWQSTFDAFLAAPVR
jgi:endo-1,4-beta-xylanase